MISHHSMYLRPMRMWYYVALIWMCVIRTVRLDSTSDESNSEMSFWSECRLNQANSTRSNVIDQIDEGDPSWMGLALEGPMARKKQLEEPKAPDNSNMDTEHLLMNNSIKDIGGFLMRCCLVEMNIVKMTGPATIEKHWWRIAYDDREMSVGCLSGKYIPIRRELRLDPRVLQPHLCDITPKYMQYHRITASNWTTKTQYEARLRG
ncbi:hypothetical protein NEHOM01_2228 [Nematocida homosporus]|uniref:uncharacterized protein n=1 Tax=Nematocida homosporus TaxID=1912981 RepID=UPI00221EA775|nr:uncharacterized protein NEHOM01_2228 [Nematocida homosporus]KAI5187505.1 hypothetical protein NEHOM01_2228 [Nematocida homosporus]